MSSSLRTLFSFPWLGVLATAACGSPPTSTVRAEPADQRIIIGRPCEELRHAALAHAPLAVLLEIANVQSALVRPLKQELATPVNANPVGATRLEPGKAANLPWGRCSNQACTSKDDATLVVRSLGFPESGSASLELELELSVAGSEVARTSVRTQDQQPVIAPWSASAGQDGTMVVTPYYLADAESSRKPFMNCLGSP